MTVRVTTQNSDRTGDYLGFYASVTPVGTRDTARKKILDRRPPVTCPRVRTLLPGRARPQTEPLTPRRQRSMQDELPVVGEGAFVHCNH